MASERAEKKLLEIQWIEAWKRSTCWPGSPVRIVMTTKRWAVRPFSPWLVAILKLFGHDVCFIKSVFYICMPRLWIDASCIRICTTSTSENVAIQHEGEEASPSVSLAMLSTNMSSLKVCIAIYRETSPQCIVFSRSLAASTLERFQQNLLEESMFEMEGIP